MSLPESTCERVAGVGGTLPSSSKTEWWRNSGAGEIGEAM